jgi:menaquinone-9 beta-reductase
MKVEDSFDAIVIGAGPAGSSTAFHLCKKGWRVALIEKSRMPRDKACGDGLGTGSVAMLNSMDLTPRLHEYQRIDGVDIRIKGESSCASDFPHEHNTAHGLVVPRRELDLLIANRARQEGSAWYEGYRVTGFEFSNGRVSDVQFVNGKEGKLRTRFAVIADGGNSNLASKAGIPKPSCETIGYAIRGYFRNVPARASAFHIHLPLVEGEAKRAIPGYGWVFPLKNGFANIGVGYYPTRRQDRNLNLRQLFTRFLEELVQSEPAMAGMEQVGKWIGGTLRSGMDPSCCFARNVLVVGDAAGLVDPFTGEGIDTALVSGQYAAEALDAALRRNKEDCLREYSDLLQRRYCSRFQLGDRFVKTYVFIWKLVQATVDQQGPLLNKVRQSLFSYSGSEQAPPTVLTSDLDRFRAHVAAETKIIATGEFPVFSRLALCMQNRQYASFRQALMFWAFQIEEAQPDQPLITVSACLELAQLVHLIQTEVVSGPGRNHWANSFAIMCGNYLLTQAFSAIQPLGYELTGIVARAAGKLCRDTIERCVESDRKEDGGEHPQTDSAFLGTAARIAGRLAGCSLSAQDALESFGSLLSPGESTDHLQAEQILAAFPESKAKVELLKLACGGR